MIRICAKTFDQSGVVTIRGASTTQRLPRRVNRVATLDGGAAVNDGGFSHADRSLSIVWQPTGRSQVASVERLVSLHPRVIVYSEDGAFECVIEDYAPNRDECRLTLLPIEKISED